MFYLSTKCKNNYKNLKFIFLNIYRFYKNAKKSCKNCNIYV